MLKVIIATCALFSLGISAHAQNARVYAGLDIFAVANGADSWKDATEEAINDLVNVIGYDSAGYTMKTSPGFGARFGVRMPFVGTEGATWGGSLGYIKGPESDIKVNAASTIAGPGNYTSNTKTSFLRFLAEVSKTFKLGDSNDKATSSFGITAGIGMAQGTIECDSKYSGSFVTTLGLSNEKDSKTWTGFTWEITPSMRIPSGTTEIEIGLRMAGFPTLEESSDWNEFAWTPFGSFVALHF